MTPNEILELRTRLRISQAELAQIAGVTQPTVAGWESGYRKPSKSAIIAINAHLSGRSIAVSLANNERRCAWLLAEGCLNGQTGVGRCSTMATNAGIIAELLAAPRPRILHDQQEGLHETSTTVVRMACNTPSGAVAAAHDEMVKHFPKMADEIAELCRYTLQQLIDNCSWQPSAKGD